MNKSLHVARRLAAVATLCGLSGCMNTTYYDDAPRHDVRFQSELAATTFYNAVLAEHYPPPPTLPCGKPAHVTFTIWIGQSFVTWNHKKSSNIIFNDAAAQADTNHDGLITEAEATAFANTVQAKFAAHHKTPPACSSPPKAPAATNPPKPST
jgi:hypothetical protein